MKTRELIHNEVALKVALWKTTVEANLFNGTSTKTLKITKNKNSLHNYKAEFLKELNIFLLKNPKYNTPEWRVYLTDLAKRESSFNRLNGNGTYLGWFALNKKGPYWSGYGALDLFLNMIKYTENNLKTINSIFTPLLLKDFQRKGISIWGLLGGSHLGGPNGVKNYLLKGVDKSDNNNTHISDYIIEMNLGKTDLQRNSNSKRIIKYKTPYEGRSNTDFNTPYITQDTQTIINQNLDLFYLNLLLELLLMLSYLDNLNTLIEEANLVWNTLNNPKLEETSLVLSLEEELLKIQELKEQELGQLALAEISLGLIYKNQFDTNNPSRTDILQPQEELTSLSNDPDRYYRLLEQKYYRNIIDKGENLFSMGSNLENSNSSKSSYPSSTRWGDWYDLGYSELEYQNEMARRKIINRERALKEALEKAERSVRTRMRNSRKEPNHSGINTSKEEEEKQVKRAKEEVAFLLQLAFDKQDKLAAFINKEIKHAKAINDAVTQDVLNLYNTGVIAANALMQADLEVRDKNANLAKDIKKGFEAALTVAELGASGISLGHAATNALKWYNSTNRGKLFVWNLLNKSVLPAQKTGTVVDLILTGLATNPFDEWDNALETVGGTAGIMGASDWFRNAPIPQKWRNRIDNTLDFIGVTLNLWDWVKFGLEKADPYTNNFYSNTKSAINDYLNNILDPQNDPNDPRYNGTLIYDLDYGYYDPNNPPLEILDKQKAIDMEIVRQMEERNSKAKGGNLFSGEEPHTQSLDKTLYDTYNLGYLPEVNVIGTHKPVTIMYDKNTGEYSRKSTGDILTPINTSLSNKPSDWTYQDINGNMYTPHRELNIGNITLGRERNNLDRILSWSNLHYNDPIMGAAARWAESWHNDRNPIKAAFNYFDPTGLVDYGLNKGIDLYNQGTDALGTEDAVMAGMMILPVVGKGILRAKKFTSLLDWSPENYFGKIGRANRTRVNGTYIEPDAEDIATLKSLVPEYEQIEELAVKNKDFIIGEDGKYIVVDEPSMSPYEWILRHSKNGLQYRQEHAYTGVSNVHKDYFLEDAKNSNVWATRTKPEDVAEYASTPLGGEAPYTAERKSLRVQKYLDKVNRYLLAIDEATQNGINYVTVDGENIPIERAKTVLENLQYMLNHEIKEPILHGGSIYDVTIPADIPSHYWGDAGGAKWSVLPFGESKRISIKYEIEGELNNLYNYLGTLDYNTTMPKETVASVKSLIQKKIDELELKLKNGDYYYDLPGVMSTDAAVAKDVENDIGNTMINNVMDTYNGTMLDESIYHAGVPKKVWLGNNGAMDRNNKSPLKSLLLPIGITSSIGLPFFLNSTNQLSLGGSLNKGDILEVSEKQMQELLKQGYKIELQ